MKVDRTEFLALAAAIATGCTPGKPADPPKASSDGDAAVAEAPTSFKPGWLEVANHLVRDPSELSQGPADECCHWVAPKPPTPPCVEKGPFTAKTRCDEIVRTAPHCGSQAYAREVCRGALTYLEPAIASLTVECLVDNADGSCSDLWSYRCIEMSLFRSCLDPAADAPCKTIVDACATNQSTPHGPLNMERCQHYLSGMKPNGRAAMVDCVTKTKCEPGFWACTVGIRN